MAVKSSKRQPKLPIGCAAKIAFEIDSPRNGCCQAARALTMQAQCDEMELEECARLDDALAHAQRIIKTTVRDIMLARIKRGSRRSRAQ